MTSSRDTAPLADPASNALLAALPQADRERVENNLSRSHLVAGQILVERGQQEEDVYFVEAGIVSFMAGTEMEGGMVQVAMVGCEGIVAGCALLGGAAASAEIIVQVPGPALRMPLHALRERMAELPAFNDACLDAVQLWIGQIMLNASAAAQLALLERCARWLLMVHDRLGSDDLPVTHEAMSTMLGARRSGVTQAIAVLQGKSLVRTRRGGIVILDRPKLEALVRAGAGRPTRRKLDLSTLNPISKGYDS